VTCYLLPPKNSINGTTVGGGFVSAVEALNGSMRMLICDFRLLPHAAAELSALAERLAALALSARIDWPDSWSNEDLQELKTAR